METFQRSQNLEAAAWGITNAGVESILVTDEDERWTEASRRDRRNAKPWNSFHGDRISFLFFGRDARSGDGNYLILLQLHYSSELKK